MKTFGKGFVSNFEVSELYMFEAGKLQHFDVKEVSFHRNEDGNFLGEMKLKLPNDDLVVRNEDPKKGWPVAFSSDLSFKKDIKIVPSDTFIDNIHFVNIHGAVVKDGYMDYWDMQYGEPIKEHKLINEIRWTPENGYQLVSEPPVASYRTRDELLSWSEYVSVDENGEETKHIGANKLAMLDADQMDLVKRLNEVLTDMKNNGIELTTDCCDNLIAINTRHFEDFAYTYDFHPEIDGWTRPGEGIDREAKQFRVGSIDTYGDDVTLMALLKDEEVKNN